MKALYSKLYNIIIVDKFWINFLLGVVSAFLFPFILPFQFDKLISIRDVQCVTMLNQLTWALIIFFLSRVIMNTYSLPDQIKYLFNNNLQIIRDSYYKGIYTIFTDSTNNFEEFEKYLKSASGLESPLRSVVLDFIVSSLGSIGNNGFAMIDAKIDVYVKYIIESLRKSQKAIIICSVRPYWFVTDSIQNVTLPPCKHGNIYEHGKGEHLIFQTGIGKKFQRWLVLTENVVLEILLSAFIDNYFVEKINNNNCPVCQILNEKDKGLCPYHGSRIKKADIDDIPEIYWFKKEVNEKIGVELIYTIIPEEHKYNFKELEDSVFIYDPQPCLDIKFHFTNLEKGNLKIKWGTKAQSIEFIKDYNLKVNPATGNEDENGHTFYKEFEQVLKDEKKKEKMKIWLNFLKTQIDDNFSTINIKNIRGYTADQLRKILCNGEVSFKNRILDAISSFIEDLETESLIDIYNKLLRFYKQNDIPTRSYIVTYDSQHPEYPLRVSSWQQNWSEIKMKSKER